MRWKAKHIVLGLTLLILSGCATRETYLMPDPDAESQAAGAAYTADGMHFRKDMPYRPDWEPVEFYYKQCSLRGKPSYYSKTSYSCTDPY